MLHGKDLFSVDKDFSLHGRDFVFLRKTISLRGKTFALQGRAYCCILKCFYCGVAQNSSAPEFFRVY